MDTQYTPTYNRLWNREFTLLTIAELLLCISCYMTIPLLPFRLTTEEHASSSLASFTIVTFIIGVCISGFFGSWLIQNYRRNKVFLVSAICLGATILGLSAFEFQEQPIVREIEEYTLLAICFASGAVFGTAKRVLSCTLLIDKTESCHRTDANYTAIWIARLTVIIGPILALLLREELRGSLFYIVGAAMSLASAVLVMCVKFPFRAPEEACAFSFYRPFLPATWRNNSTCDSTYHRLTRHSDDHTPNDRVLHIGDGRLLLGSMCTTHTSHKERTLRFCRRKHIGDNSYSHNVRTRRHSG